MLRLLDFDKAFLPAKRLFDMKPLNRVSFTDANVTIHYATISSN